MANEATMARKADEGLLKPQEVASLLGCSRRTVSEMITAGTLHAVDISVKGARAKRHAWRLRRREVEAFIRSRVMRGLGGDEGEGEPSDDTKAA